ncbi:epoxide hydrolase family protein [Saccharomonospora xinjiangensis]|uniref:Putative hydrolase or acyltransferase of alpha/beta superfamily n=1 Tax=Saccharomonospora xinjiangensis XJ-54 TaxID=882086 RepID=I0UXW5_9PSEU|nr:epoxide hydrolase family protein [Saccharomonospora xinjiangensis]EID52718.1 putative hydrolase or acyltransferase of alpha/beta superfamily [Saccharomonospora xinjiangensis XJ-54]
MIEPFRVHIDDEVLDDLRTRLDATRWPDELPGAGHDYGIPLARVRQLAEHWLTGYDWRACERELNAIPQYVTEIEGQRVHFLHARSSARDALPLLLTHGWPGSVVEFLDVLPLLTRRFHVVVPSIPGFGFSGPTTRRGWDTTRVATAWAELMARLGYRRYGVQGGDWGAAISRLVAQAAPEAVVGVHLNYLPTPALEAELRELSPAERARVEHTNAFAANRPAYQLVQAQMPQTLAFGLTDSPVGQLAWIASRFDEWTDPRSVVADDRILTDVMIYWVTRTAASSARLYRESGPLTGTSGTPVGVAVFAHDLNLPARPIAQRRLNIVHWAEYDRGGHFAAMEVPALFADDVTTFFEAVR